MSLPNLKKTSITVSFSGAALVILGFATVNGFFALMGLLAFCAGIVGLLAHYLPMAIGLIASNSKNDPNSQEEYSGKGTGSIRSEDESTMRKSSDRLKAKPSPSMAHQESALLHQRQTKGISPNDIEPNTLRWLNSGEVFRFVGHEINTGLFYVSRQDSEREASAIDVSLPVERTSLEQSLPVPYYPTYADLSAQQRGEYLRWLANGRTDFEPEKRDHGYLFLFFYGAERRLLLDGSTNMDLVEELIRLMKTYSPEGRSSLNHYFSSLIFFWGWRQGPQFFTRLCLPLLGREYISIEEDELAMILASLCETATPMPASVARLVVERDEAAKKGVVVDRVRDEFIRLFDLRYKEMYGEGINLRCSKRNKTIRYERRNVSVSDRSGPMRIESRGTKVLEETITNVLGIPSQFAPLTKIWNNCVEDLSGYSREIGRSGRESISLKAHLKLPKELLLDIEHPLESQWQSLLQESKHEGGFAFLPVKRLAEMADLDERKMLTTTQSRLVAEVVSSFHFIVVPDARFDGDNYQWEQHVAVFPSSTSDSASEPSSMELALEAMLKLSIMVAAADGDIDKQEIEVFKRYIGMNLALNEVAQRRISALEKLLVMDSESMKFSVSKICERIPQERSALVIRVLAEIVSADGNVSREEFKCLTKIAKGFRGIDNPDDFVKEVLDEIRGALLETQEPVREGETIPSRDSVGGIALDSSKIARISQETNEVFQMLKTAFEEQDAGVLERNFTSNTRQEKTGSSRDRAKGVPSWVDGLDPKYQEFLFQLTAQGGVLSETEFDSLARKHKLMPGDALTSINEWSDEKFGDLLLFEGEEIEINEDIVLELEKDIQ